MKTEAEIMAEIQKCEQVLDEKRKEIGEAIGEIDYDRMRKLKDEAIFPHHLLLALMWVMDMPIPGNPPDYDDWGL